MNKNGKTSYYATNYSKRHNVRLDGLQNEDKNIISMLLLFEPEEMKLE